MEGRSLMKLTVLVSFDEEDLEKLGLMASQMGLTPSTLARLLIRGSISGTRSLLLAYSTPIATHPDAKPWRRVAKGCYGFPTEYSRARNTLHNRHGTDKPEDSPYLGRESGGNQGRPSFDYKEAVRQ